MQARLELTQSGRFFVVLASLALAAAWTTGNAAARLAACLLVAPLLVDWASKARDWRSLQLGLGRRRTRAGAPFLERLLLRNGTRRTLRGVHLGEAGLVASPRGQGAFLEHVRAGSEMEIELPLRARARGRADTRLFWLTTQHPLGLVRLRAELRVPAVVVAEPARVPLALELAEVEAEGAHESAPNALATGETFWTLRELLPGEDIGRVHALRSATLAMPVRTLERGARRALAQMVVDLRSAPARSRARAGGRGFEWGLSAAATLMDELVARGRDVEVVVLEPRPRWFRGLREPAGSEAFLEYLAGAQPAPFAPFPRGALPQVAAGAGGRFWIVAGGFAATEDLAALGAGFEVLEWS